MYLLAKSSLLVCLSIVTCLAQKNEHQSDFGEGFDFGFGFDSQKFGGDFDPDIEDQFSDLRSGSFSAFGREKHRDDHEFQSYRNSDSDHDKPDSSFFGSDGPSKGFATGFVNFPGIDFGSKFSGELKESSISDLIPKKNEISYLPALHSSTFSGPKPDILSFKPVKGVQVNFRPDEYEKSKQSSFFDQDNSKHGFFDQENSKHSFFNDFEVNQKQTLSKEGRDPPKKVYQSPPKREVSHSTKERESYQPPVYHPQVTSKITGDPYKQGGSLSSYEPEPVKPQYSYKTQGPIKQSHGSYRPHQSYKPEVHQDQYNPPHKSVSQGPKEIKELEPVYAKELHPSNSGFKAPVHFDEGYNSPVHADIHHQPDPYHQKRSNIPGEPGKDYPVFNEVPYTDFSCAGVPTRPGMYANVEAGCQVYHVCHDERYGEQGAAFLCTNGTVFNQATFSCDWWYNVDCGNSRSLYELNTDPKYNPYYQPPYEGPIHLPDYDGHSGHPSPHGLPPLHGSYQPAGPSFREEPDHHHSDGQFQGPSSFQGHSSSFQEPSSSFQGPKSPFQGPSSSFRGESSSFQEPFPSFQGHSNSFKGTFSSQGHSSSFKEPSSSLQGHSSSFKEPSSSFQRHSSSFKEPSSSLQGHSSSFKEPSSSFQGHSSSFKEPSSSFQGHSSSFKGHSSSFKGPSSFQEHSSSFQEPPSSFQGHSGSFQGPSSPSQGTSFRSSLTPFTRTQRDSTQQAEDMEHTRFEDLPPFDSEDSQFKSFF